MRTKLSVQLDKYYKSISHCKDCNLWRKRRQVVSGCGAVPADLICIGISPGKSEDLIGESFVGETSKFINYMIKEASKKIGKEKPSIYKVNLVLCRSFITDINDEKYGSNCDPLDHQVLSCLPKIMHIIDTVRAKNMILFGKVPAKYLSNVFPSALSLLHPAFLLREGGTSSKFYNQTIRKLMEFL